MQEKTLYFNFLVFMSCFYEMKKVYNFGARKVFGAVLFRIRMK